MPAWVDRRQKQLLKTAVRRIISGLGPLFFALGLFIVLGTRGHVGAWGAVAAMLCLLAAVAVILIMAAKTISSLSATERMALGILALVGAVGGVSFGVWFLLP